MDAGVLSGLSPSLSLCPSLLSLLWLAPSLFLLLPSVRCRPRASYKSYHYSNSFRFCKSCMRHIYRVGRATSQCAGTLAFQFGLKRLHTYVPGCAAGQYEYVLCMCDTYCERDELWRLILQAAAAAAAAVLLRTVKSS